MSLLARLAPHLPYIRRYARALTGDQSTGDHYVRVALEALAAGERSLDGDLSPRVALYRVFHAIWLSSGAQLEARRDEGLTAGDDATQRLSATYKSTSPTPAATMQQSNTPPPAPRRRRSKFPKPA